jgi:hypothetical protein
VDFAGELADQCFEITTAAAAPASAIAKSTTVVLLPHRRSVPILGKLGHGGIMRRNVTSARTSAIIIISFIQPQR